MRAAETRTIVFYRLIIAKGAGVANLKTWVVRE